MVTPSRALGKCCAIADGAPLGQALSACRKAAAEAQAHAEAEAKRKAEAEAKSKIVPITARCGNTCAAPTARA
ncbi:MAG: hypothetical protein NTW87_25035 [Planctomycetota bacterium]|nr:hypothetical protein [Planctomycetota bacterium]